MEQDRKCPATYKSYNICSDLLCLSASPEDSLPVIPSSTCPKAIGQQTADSSTINQTGASPSIMLMPPNEWACREWPDLYPPVKHRKETKGSWADRWVKFGMFYVSFWQQKNDLLPSLGLFFHDWSVDLFPGAMGVPKNSDTAWWMMDFIKTDRRFG